MRAARPGERDDAQAVATITAQPEAQVADQAEALAHRDDARRAAGARASRPPADQLPDPQHQQRRRHQQQPQVERRGDAERADVDRRDHLSPSSESGALAGFAATSVRSLPSSGM